MLDPATRLSGRRAFVVGEGRIKMAERLRPYPARAADLSRPTFPVRTKTKTRAAPAVHVLYDPNAYIIVIVEISLSFIVVVVVVSPVVVANDDVVKWHVDRKVIDRAPEAPAGIFHIRILVSKVKKKKNIARENRVNNLEKIGFLSRFLLLSKHREHILTLLIFWRKLSDNIYDQGAQEWQISKGTYGPGTSLKRPQKISSVGAKLSKTFNCILHFLG